MEDETAPMSLTDHPDPTEPTNNRPTKDYGPDSLLSVLKPVTLCMAIVICIVETIPVYSKTETQLIYTPLSETDSSDNIIVSNVFLNALIFIAFVVAMTVLLVFLYVKKYYKIINAWLLFSSCMILFFFTYDFLWNVCKHFRIPVDIISAVMLTWNIGVFGVLHVHINNSSPRVVQQVYLIYFSVLCALIFIRYLPEWSTWTVLGILAIWDLVAVLCPRGPLRVLVETAQERNEQIMPSLIYSTMASPEGEGVRQEDEGPKLGLGDFIFYSILVGRATSSGDGISVVFCLVAILVGLIFTLALLVLANRALPALPISIAFAVVVFFTVHYTTSPFVNRLVLNSLFI